MGSIPLNTLRQAEGKLAILRQNCVGCLVHKGSASQHPNAGETCSIQPMEVEQPLLPAGQISPSDDLAAQVTSQPPRFVLVSTAGTPTAHTQHPRPD